MIKETRYNEVKKLNIGSGRKKMDGYTNVDALEWDGNTDIMHDLTNIPYPFKGGRIDEIFCGETLEHISFRDTFYVLIEFYRILKEGGKLSIQVPDCGKMMKYYVNGQVCNCVNHKDTGEGFSANKDCLECKGKAIVNSTRWFYAFTGAQEHFPHDIHKTIFTRELLEGMLELSGFSDIKFKDDIYKLKVKCVKL